jgi:hypothetical protein
MAHCEVESFVTKFKHLWHAGIKVSLTIEAVDGQASVTLTAGLGNLPPPLHPHGPHGQPFRHHRGPAYQRRQERRKAAGKAAGQLSSPSVHVQDVIAAAQANDTSENVAETAQSSDISEDKTKTAEQAQDNFPCPICDFVSSWANGLQIHMAKKHANLEQVDGNDTVLEDEDDKYTETEHYWKTGQLRTIYQTFLDVNKIIDSSNLQEESKKLEKEKALESRKFAFGSNFKHVPPWNKIW